MENKAEATEDLQTLGELVDDIEVAMMTSIAPDGRLVSRPLATLQADEHGDLWFFTRGDSGKIDDISLHPQVNLAYADPSKNLYVSVVGRAQLLRDRAKIEELWHPRAAAFFPGGKDDPELVLLKVEVESAEYWRNASGIVNRALQLMHTVTGTGPEALGENRRLEV